MKASQDRRIGAVLAGTWRLDAVIGAGGMASVYAAVHARNGLRVAVKVLHQELAKNESVKQRFLREGYLANKIDHPGVVRVLDDGTDGEHVYLVMELLRGQTLKELWKQRARAIPATEVERIVGSILELLVAAHGAGVVHRDLKPDNIFLLEDGTPKLLDFGIARILEEHALSENATATGTMLGTPAFMPPEQALGRWDQVDGRSDLFALAATAWLLLTGKLVHEATSIPELLVATATKAARPIRSVSAEVPAHLAAVIDRALAFSRDDRWPDARAMLEALRAPSTPVATPPPAAEVEQPGDPERSATLEMHQLVPEHSPEHAQRPVPDEDDVAELVPEQMTRMLDVNHSSARTVPMLARDVLAREMVHRARPPSQEPSRDDGSGEPAAATVLLDASAFRSSPSFSSSAPSAAMGSGSYAGEQSSLPEASWASGAGAGGAASHTMGAFGSAPAPPALRERSASSPLAAQVPGIDQRWLLGGAIALGVLVLALAIWLVPRGADGGPTPDAAPATPPPVLAPDSPPTPTEAAPATAAASPPPALPPSAEQPSDQAPSAQATSAQATSAQATSAQATSGQPPPAPTAAASAPPATVWVTQKVCPPMDMNGKRGPCRNVRVQVPAR